MLLDDGASYHEASLSATVPRTTLREIYPDMGWTEKEGGQFALSIMRHPHLYEMHKSIGLLATI